MVCLHEEGHTRLNGMEFNCQPVGGINLGHT